MIILHVYWCSSIWCRLANKLMKYYHCIFFELFYFKVCLTTETKLYWHILRVTFILSVLLIASSNFTKGFLEKLKRDKSLWIFLACMQSSATYCVNYVCWNRNSIYMHVQYNTLHPNSYFIHSILSENKQIEMSITSV